MRLVRASSAVTRDLSAQLQADHGLTLNTYEALLMLARAPDRRMRRVDLANSLLLTAGGVTRLLDGLEREGFVGREGCDSDRRVTYAVLTKAGRDKLREVDKTHVRQIRELMGSYYDARRARAALRAARPRAGRRAGLAACSDHEPQHRDAEVRMPTARSSLSPPAK